MTKDIYSEAKKRVKEKKKFHQDLSSFIIWGGAMLFINLFITRGYMWSLWVIFFWGLSVLKKAFDVYGFPFGQNEDWEEREIQKEMKRIKRLGDGSDKIELDEQDFEQYHIPERKAEKRASWKDEDLV